MIGLDHAPELVALLIIAFLVFGPEKLPELARGAGRGLREFRRMTSELQGSFSSTLQEVQDIQREMTQSVQEASQLASESIHSTVSPLMTSPGGSAEWAAPSSVPTEPAALDTASSSAPAVSSSEDWGAGAPAKPAVRLPAVRRPSVSSSLSALAAGAGTSLDRPAVSASAPNGVQPDTSAKS